MSDPAPTLVDVHAHFVTDDYIAAAKAAGHVYPDVRHVASMDGAQQPEGETWRTLTTRNAARLLPHISAGEACDRARTP